MLGINSEGNGSSRAEIDGTVNNPYSNNRRGKNSPSASISNGSLYITILSIIVIVLSICLCKQKLDERKRNRTFAATLAMKNEDVEKLDDHEDKLIKEEEEEEKIN